MGDGVFWYVVEVGLDGYAGFDKADVHIDGVALDAVGFPFFEVADVLDNVACGEGDGVG